jgi:hypothetical protein
VLQNFGTKWNISASALTYEDLHFQINYQVSDFVQDSMVFVSMWDENCNEGGVSVSEILHTITGDATPIGSGTEEREVGVDFTLNTNTIESSSIFTDTRRSDERVVVVGVFCVRFGIYTSGATPVEVNFLERLVQLQVEMTNGIAITGVNVTAVEAVEETTTTLYQIIAYDCDYSNTTFSQGDLLKVCVEPNEEATGDGITMQSVDTFAFTLTTADSTLVQYAVVDGTEAENGLTELFCISGNVTCEVQTVLNAQFYETSGIVDATGVATMRYGSTRARRLGGPSDEGRDLQEAGQSEFSVQFPLLETPKYPPPPGFLEMEAAVVGGMVAMSVLGLTAVFSMVLLFLQLPRFKHCGMHV